MAEVVAAWTASHDPALKVARGEVLRAMGRDPENPGWRWCENAAGLGGWLPEDLVRDGRATESFDSTELTVAVGDTVTCLTARAGWRWCRTEGGRAGWVPVHCLRMG